MLRPAKSVAEKMIKVDHTGENGAVNIYRAQRIIAHIRAPHIIEQLKDFQSHEEEHRDIFSRRLTELGVRRCYEMAHHQTAEMQMQHDKHLTKALVIIVKLCTEAVIRFGMR